MTTLSDDCRSPADELVLYHHDSYRELVNKGVSDDEDLRVFETGWQGDSVTVWAERPLFLTADPTLASKSAELRADLAALLAAAAVSRLGKKS